MRSQKYIDFIIIYEHFTDRYITAYIYIYIYNYIIYALYMLSDLYYNVKRLSIIITY